MQTFSILNHLDQLTPVPGKSTPQTGEYYCPLCRAENFKVDLKTGKYNAFGCGCTQTEEGKARVREAVSPLTWKKAIRPQDRREFIYDALEYGASVSAARVVRTDDGEGKREFYQQHWDGAKWVKGLPDKVKASLHLYRIFSPVNEQAKGQRIYLVEGEGKVDDLLRLGIPATCSIGGAGKWKQYGYPNYLEDLKGYEVVLCPDRDEVGIKHCEEVEADLLAHGIAVAGWLYAFPDSVLWQHLPKNGGADVSDWLAEGASLEDITNGVEPRRDLSPPAAPAGEAEGNGGEPDWGENACGMKRRYFQIKQQVGDRLRFNTLTKGIELDGEALDIDDLQVRLAIEHNIQTPDSQFQKIVGALARENPYSPVVEYLDQVAQEHGTDTRILEDLSKRYFGTEHPLHDIYIRKTLIAAVARAYEPGCKVDTACILKGRQATRKSTFFETLASKRWFDDSLGNASDKDERLKLHRVWIVEWAELETIFKRKDVATVKAFLTCSRDLVRPPYGRTVQEFDRGSIIVGTTNEDEFLVDPTGSRRYWIIPVSKRINIDQLRQERDRIWAAAVAAYRAGEQWWLNDAEAVISEELNEEYAARDPWADAIEAYVNDLNADEVTVEQILLNCIKLDLDKQDRRAQMRVCATLKQMGWVKNRRRINGQRTYTWTRNENEKSFVQETGWDSWDRKMEPLNSNSLTLSQPLSQPTKQGWDGWDSVTGNCHTEPPSCPNRPNLSQPQNEGKDSLKALPSEGLNPLSQPSQTNGSTFGFFRAIAVGDIVRKVNRKGWRGEVVAIAGEDQVDVLWVGERRPHRHYVSDLEQVETASQGLNGVR